MKMMDNLKRRLEQLKAENVQLEEMLRHADARASGTPGPSASSAPSVQGMQEHFWAIVDHSPLYVAAPGCIRFCRW